jgi:putative ABC transport system ATP-binding protein
VQSYRSALVARADLRVTSIVEKRVAAETIVDLSAVRFSWSAGESSTLDIDSLRLARGERLFLRGPSGSGKSTLLNLIAGVVTPQSGTIKLLGTDTSALSGAARDRFRADHIGYIFQMFNLLPYLSVIENVGLPCRFSPRRRARILETGTDIDAEAVRLLGELDLRGSLLDRAITELSVGQQQRVAAARALIGAPELVIADEPTSALDSDRRTAFLDLLFRQCERENAALIFASHDASLAPLFERTVALAERHRAAKGVG